MIERHANTLSRLASPPTRRMALAALGSAGLTAALRPERASAKKLSKKAKRRARKKGRKKCKKQIGQCTAVFEELCAVQADPATCEAQFIPCCPLFSGCQVDAFIACAFSLT